MQIYNTLSRTIEDFVPHNLPKVGLYACGFTVYDYTHLGHLRKYTMDDMLVRVLESQGYEVSFVQNVTDVGHLTSDGDTGEDKLEKGAKKYNKTVWEIAREFEQYFWHSMDQMGVRRPDVSCRATEHIEAQLAMVIELERKGFAYEIAGDGMYFDTSKFAEYGTLARLQLEKQQEGARVDVVAGKRNPTDFALWKFEREGENRAMVWPSPWHQRSFPGWHIECSAMAMQYLGDQLDIHTGGIDHIPVHHTNEIAQAEAVSGARPFVKYWVHHNFLRVEGEKMSKSLGNFFTIDDVLERGFHPRALRLLFLGSHYRSELNFTWQALAGAQTALEKLVRAYASVETAETSATSATAAADKPLSHKAAEYLADFTAALAHDLHTPQAVAILWQVVDADLPSQEKRELLARFDTLFGLGLDQLMLEGVGATGAHATTLAQDDPALPEVVRELLQVRQQARADKDWAAADAARDSLAEQGYQVEDTPEGQRVHIQS